MQCDVVFNETVVFSQAETGVIIPIHSTTHIEGLRVLTDMSVHCSDEIHSQSVAYAPDPNIPQLPANSDEQCEPLTAFDRLRFTCKSPFLVEV